MNNHNNHQDPNQTKPSQPIQKQSDDSSQRQSWQTERYANSIVDYLVNISANIGQRNKEVIAMLQVYSKEKTMGNINEINDLFFCSMAMPIISKGQQAEPEPLRIDSLLPISADIDQNNEKPIFKNFSFGGMSQIRSRVTGTARDSPTPKEIYLKLDLPPPEQEDGLTKQLRRIQQQRFNKKEIERKQAQKKEKIRQQKLKDKKNQKEEKFSYGYNGEVIQVKIQNKFNLVSKVINGMTNDGIKVVKQVCNDPNPTRLQGIKPGKKDKKIININITPKLKNEVQFSQINSLAQNIKTNNGVKYIYQGKTYEEKRKVVTANELKKTLSQRKISKEEFTKIRNLNGNRQQYQQLLRKSNVKNDSYNETNHQRAKSQSRISESKHMKTKEMIHISSKNLRQKLLEKDLNPLNTMNEQTPQDQQPSQANRLGSIDNFNLQYIRTGGSLQTKTSKQFFSTSRNQLPKITHTTLYSKAMPKGRQRIKDSNEIIRDLRKRFQEKLRV